MPFSIGDRLGPYEILAPIGAGGMGEVWKARDTRLGRVVAIKTLPPGLADSAEFRDRFEREARMIASLNHPHICTLHDVGHHREMDYLVMEFLEGETLASRLVKGPLPLEQALQYAIQIAGALDKAHRLRMTHRDLKPGNIMLTKSGAKLLDLGLAKLEQGASAPELPPSQVSTALNSLTAQGTILGTVQYMAPEQLEGREADARTDIFALGTVIYEMVTGKKAFEGNSTASIIANILRTDPAPIRSFQPMTSPALERVVSACLAKDPDNRLQSAQDVKLELGWIRDAAAEPGGVTPRARGLWTLTWAILAIGALAFAVFAWMRASANRQMAAEPVRLQITLPAKPPLRLTGVLALSPSGRQLAFVAASADGIPRIWIRALNSLEVHPLQGAETGWNLLFWSPDSRFLAFESDGKLRKISVSGGPAETICVLEKGGVGGSWNTEGTIIFGQFGGVIMRVSAAGGVAAPVTVLDPAHGDVAHVNPRFLPDGRHFLYVSDLGVDFAILVGSVDSKPEQQDYRRLVRAGFGAVYVPSPDPGIGQMLFVRGQTLMAQPFDARHLKIYGEPVRVLEEPVANFLDAGLFSVSDNGTLAYWSPGNAETQLTWFDAHGKRLGTVGNPGPYGTLSLSPDGTQAIVSKFGADSNASLWLMDLSRGTSTRFETDPPDDWPVVWAPDGRSFLFSSFRAGKMSDVYQVHLTGKASPELLVQTNEAKDPVSWSPDGRFLLYNSQGPGTNGDLWVLPLDGHKKPVPFLQTKSDEPDARFSPDGRWVAYVSNESGRYEVLVAPFSPDAPDGGDSDTRQKRLISDNGGVSPSWRRDGKELYYVDLSGKLMAVTFTGGPTLEAGVPRFLFQAPRRPGDDQVQAQWAPSQDGKRFLFLEPTTQQVAPFTVVLNWQAGLKK
jgi:Tol biopolymer transport system component